MSTVVHIFILYYLKIVEFGAQNYPEDELKRGTCLRKIIVCRIYFQRMHAPESAADQMASSVPRASRIFLAIGHSAALTATGVRFS